MTASLFAYRHRLWISLSIYCAAFACWPLDRRDVSGVLTKLFAPTPLGAGLGFLFAAVLVGLAAGLLTWSSERKTRHFATWLCWVAFGLLLNRLGFLIVVVGMTVFLYRLAGRDAAESAERTPAWRRSLPFWIAAAALVTLALTLKESWFFLVLAGGLLARMVSGTAR